MIRVAVTGLCLAAAGCSSETPRGEPTAAAVEASETGPSAVLEEYYGALSRRDYETAWQLWGQDPAAPDDRFQAFIDGFENTELAIAEIGDPQPASEVGGYVYVKVPVEVEDLKSDGSGNSYRGTYTLRRESGEDMPWHIFQGDLQVTG